MKIVVADNLFITGKILKNHVISRGDQLIRYPEKKLETVLQKKDFDCLICGNEIPGTFTVYSTDQTVLQKHEIFRSAASSLLGKAKLKKGGIALIIGQSALTEVFQTILAESGQNITVLNDFSELANADLKSVSCLINLMSCDEPVISLPVKGSRLKILIDLNDRCLRTPLYFFGKQLKYCSCYNRIDFLAEQYRIMAEPVSDPNWKENSSEKFRRILYRMLGNIVLIGMPTAGKTTIGSLLSQKTRMPLIETDDEIVRRIRMPIAEYFQTKGEEAFRDLESDVIASIKIRGGIVSTGGGVVLREANIRHLASNGIMIWLERDIDKMITDASRPIAADKAQLEKLYFERKELYSRYGDVRIENNGTVDETVDDIIWALQIR